MNKIFFYLTIPFRPSYWLMNYKYSSEWSEFFINSVKSNDCDIMDDYICFFWKFKGSVS